MRGSQSTEVQVQGSVSDPPFSHFNLNNTLTYTTCHVRFRPCNSRVCKNIKLESRDLLSIYILPCLAQCHWYPIAIGPRPTPQRRKHPSIKTTPCHDALYCFDHQSPWSCMAFTTLTKPAMLLPATRLGSSPSLAATYFLAVSTPLVKASFMMPLSFSSTSSEDQVKRCNDNPWLA